MSRSLKKGPYVDERLLKKIHALKQGDQKVIKTWSRRSAISPEMVGFRLGVHNGREHRTVLISEDMVGHKLANLRRPENSCDTADGWRAKKPKRRRQKERQEQNRKRSKNRRKQRKKSNGNKNFRICI